MNTPDLQRVIRDLDALTIKVNGLAGQVGDLALPPNATPLSPQSTNFQPIPIAQHPSAVNQLRNGDYSHSVNTWFEAVLNNAGDPGHECAWWFSNPTPVSGQVLSANNSITNPGVDNKTLKYTGHPFYSAAYSDWNRTTGVARFQGTTSIDAPFPSNIAKPGITEFFGAILALRNEDYPTVQYIVPVGTIIYAGVWDDTAGQLYWLQGTPFSLTASVRGTPSGTTQRNYKIFARTDKGYTFLSVEAVVANAPDDASFQAGEADVYLSWDAIPGILEYDIYRHDITAAKYRILESIGNGANTYADNGSVNIDSNAGSYPTATNSKAIAFVGTNPGDLDRVVVDGVAPAWSVVFLNIAIPASYNQSVTTAAQWIRTYLSNPIDRSVSEITTVSGNANIMASVDRFTALDDTRTGILVSEDGTGTLNPVTITYVNTKTLTLSTPPTWSDSNSTLYINEGGDHGLMIDLVHSSFVSRAAYAPNPEDLNRTLQPATAPNGSSQGGPGGGGGSGSGGGGIIQPFNPHEQAGL